VNYRDPLCEERVITALYASLGDHERHLQQVRDYGEGLARKVQNF